MVLLVFIVATVSLVLVCCANERRAKQYDGNGNLCVDVLTS